MSLFGSVTFSRLEMEAMSMLPEFVGFPKIPRYSREVIVSEKIDGTSGCIYIDDSGSFFVGSRTRWITPDNDNHGFARWAYEHKAELLTLGPGRHFGEVWGSGIQRGYGFKKGEKFFSMFNVIRWCEHGKTPKQLPQNNPKEEPQFQKVLPACVRLVPIMWRGSFEDMFAQGILEELAKYGSFAAPGYMNPEGIVIHHVAGNVSFKKTLKDDTSPKTAVKEN